MIQLSIPALSKEKKDYVSHVAFDSLSLLALCVFAGAVSSLAAGLLRLLWGHGSLHLFELMTHAYGY